MLSRSYKVLFALAVTSCAQGAVLLVNTRSDVSDGNVASVESLIANPGSDGVISLREALEVSSQATGLIIDLSTETSAVYAPLSELPPLAGSLNTLRGNGAVLTGKDCADCNGVTITGSYNEVVNIAAISFSKSGILITGESARGNLVSECSIGLFKDQPFGNGIPALHIYDGASNNVVERSIISGNVGTGVQVYGPNTRGNIIRNNKIGTNASGDTAITNGYILYNGGSYSYGIAVSAPDTQVGEVGAGNLISAQHTIAIVIFGSESAGTVLRNNQIVLQDSIAFSVPPDFYGAGVHIWDGRDIRVGGIIEEGNIIESSWKNKGISMIGEVNQEITIRNNSIQYFAPPEGASNREGISCYGGLVNCLISENVVTGWGKGVSLQVDCQNVNIYKNRIFGNRQSGIFLDEGINGGAVPPAILPGEPAQGMTFPCARVELYLDETNQGHYYIGAVYADAQGQFPLIAPEEADPALNVTAIATDRYGNSSAFSAPVSVALVARGTLPEDPAPGACANRYHVSADYNQDLSVSLEEILRLIQLYNALAYSCGTGTEDGYQPGPGARDCAPHSSDYLTPDWAIDLDELMRILQFYNAGAYEPCEGSEDGFCPVFGTP